MVPGMGADGRLSSDAVPGSQPSRSRADFQDGEDTWFERNVRSRVRFWFQVYILELLLRQKPLPPSKDGRHVPLRVVHDAVLVDERRGHAYLSNTIRSSRYTIWDFLPKQFFFQITRVHNLFFLCVGIPQTIPGISTTGNYTTILPLTFFLLATMLKEGYDDYRRHRLDKAENNSLATVLRGKNGVGPPDTLAKTFSLSLSSVIDSVPRPWRAKMATCEVEEREADEDDEVEWTKINWHDIRVGDVVRLQRNETVPADVVLLSATGEHGLAYIETMALDGETNLKSKHSPTELRGCCTIEGIRACSADLVLEDPNRDLYSFNGRYSVNGVSHPLTLSEVIYRGSVLRNTRTAFGLVVNTGEECKSRMNANHHPTAKKPRLEHYANQAILTLIVYVILLSVGLSMGYLLWHHNFEVHAWYLKDAKVKFRDILIGNAITFNNCLPLALYVSLEIVKVGQMLLMHSDIAMYDAISNAGMHCNTDTILEDLGQVTHVLSDKTGTLTENIMKFRKMSVAGLSFSHDLEPVTPPVRDAARAVDDANPEKKSGTFYYELEVGTEKGVVEGDGRPSLGLRRPSTQQPLITSTHTSLDLLDHMRKQPGSLLARKAKAFILGLALCHTALPEQTDAGDYGFQASSPDEVALVEAAGDLGFLVVQRSTRSMMILETDSAGQQHQHTYEILDVIEFSSKRKRMSIVVRCPNGRLWLLCKGADNVIIPRLRQADVAARQSYEVRRSIHRERELRRRSQQLEGRSSFGGRPSLAARPSDLSIRPDPTNNFLQIPRPSYDTRKGGNSLDASGSRQALGDYDDASFADDAAVFGKCFRQLDDFATEGLRTLIYAEKTISEADYANWKKMYQEASTSLTERQERIEAVGEVLEQSLELLGASAIEDKLQGGVPETVQMLRRANMKLWMLTGDKRETAINIAHAAKICTPDSNVVILDSAKGDMRAQLQELGLEIRTGGVHTVAVIDGHTLSSVDESAGLKHEFYALIPLLDSVICCRASPAQKADIVRAIKARVHGALTLAIGDGANDVAMIQSAHVGVGISGKEGLQAARVADFSIAQFRFLQRLLLVHGHWNYARTATFLLLTLFKEFLIYMPQALYQRCNGYTGTSLYESWSLTVLNTLFTSLCVIVPGMFEQDLKAETLLAVPELYVYGQLNKGLNLRKYFVSQLWATAIGMVIWFVSWTAFRRNVMGDNGLFALGDLCFSLAIVYTNFKLLILETHYKTKIVGVSFIITVGGWWAWNGFMSEAYSSNLSPYDVRHGFTSTFGNDWNWWLALILAISILAIAEYAYRAFKSYRLSKGERASLWRSRSARHAGEMDVSVWQELEKDPVMRTRLHELTGGHASTTESADDD